MDKNSQNSFYGIQKEIPKMNPKEKEISKEILKEIPKDHSLRKWYEFRRNSKKDSDKNITTQNKKQAENGNLLWILIYGALVTLIIILILYKFVFQK
jgi:hypothetical protein